jgi:hypothetical protein
VSLTAHSTTHLIPPTYSSPRQKYKLIVARNAYVIECLREAYSVMIPNGSLPVFCISNKDYKDHTKPRSPRRKQILNHTLIDATGVPSLQSFCRSIPAKARLDSALQLLKIQIPTLLHSMELWLSKSVGAGSGNAEHAIDENLEYHMGQV